MIVSILFIFLLFIIYSHNLHEIDYYEILIRIILFGVSIKYYYSSESFATCYPGSNEMPIKDSYNTVSKGWCKSTKDDESSSSNSYGINENEDGSGSYGDKNSIHCDLGEEPTPNESAFSNSKSWCKTK
jgi:hypothetical protein